MPLDAPQAKVDATRGYGATIVMYDRYKQNVEEITERIRKEKGMTLIPPYDHEDIVAGQGTVAKELIEKVGHLDYLFACVGGGGLISGCCLAVKALLPKCKIIGVEPEAGNDAQ